jgi:hypothetical protein
MKNITIGFIAVLLSICSYFYLSDLADKKYENKKHLYEKLSESAQRRGNYKQSEVWFDEWLKLKPGLHNLF